MLFKNFLKGWYFLILLVIGIAVFIYWDSLLIQVLVMIFIPTTLVAFALLSNYFKKSDSVLGRSSPIFGNVAVFIMLTAIFAFFLFLFSICGNGPC